LEGVKGRGKGFPLHAVKAYKEKREIAPLILDLGTRGR